MVRSVPVLLALALFSLLASAGVAGAQPFTTDHYQLYRANGPGTGTVTLIDQFGPEDIVFDQTVFFGVPTNKNDEGFIDEVSHLTCYELFPQGEAPPPPPVVSSINQFGRRQLALGVPRALCVPTEKPLLSPGLVDIDHYKCYDASDVNGPIGVPVTLEDQFQGRGTDVLDAFLFCTPVGKNGEPIDNPDDHLTCYNTEPGQSVGQVVIRNQFFPNTTEIEVAEPIALCVPSQKEVPPDHYSVYPAQGPDGPQVLLEDQFQTQLTDLGNARLFLVPALKNDEPGTDPFSHLTCYEIPGGEPAPDVSTLNQFGLQPLDLGEPRFLCTPTEKLIDPGPVTLDHYKCYDAADPAGGQVGAGVAIADQFQTRSAIVLDPVLFCTPVNKNDEPVENATDHLTCYNTTPPGQAPGGVPILNQFTPVPVDLEVGDAFGLCVPSLKDRDNDGVPDPLDNCQLTFNPSQADTNGDGCGNVCDPDITNDGVVGAPDFGLWAPTFGTFIPPSPPDHDFSEPLDAAIGAPDFGVIASFFGGPPGPGLVPDTDCDGDGMP